MKPISLVRPLRKHVGKWVAFSSEPYFGKVMGTGRTIRQALNRAHKKGEKQPILMKAAKDCGSVVLCMF